MAYSVTLYTNTGFDSMNLPDSPALLAGMSSISVPALDINQERFLPSVKIRATWNQIKDADYCKIGDFFYTIDNIFMSSQDVAELTLSPDFITSAGGPATLDILDGLTTRVHVADDTFGLYNGEDPYMNPSYDMDIVTSIHQFSGTSKTFVETTLDLQGLGLKLANGELEAWTAIDSITPVDPDDPDAKSPAVTVPMAKYLDNQTTYETAFLGSNINLLDIKKQGLFEIRDDDPIVQNWKYTTDGIVVARSLGIEESISGQFSIPSDLVTVYHTSGVTFCDKLVGAGGSINGWSSALRYEYGTANNKRVFYGSQSKYTLISTTGESISANAEEVYQTGTTAPVVNYVVDPRRTGKPYFRFAALNGNSERFDFFRGSIAGKSWDSVPLVLTDKSGSLLDRLNYSASIAQRSVDEDTSQASYGKRLLTGFGTFAVGAGGVIGGAISGVAPAAVAGASAIGSGISQIVNTGIDLYKYGNSQKIAKELEAKQFNIAQTANVPTVQFPVDPGLMNEFLHNGCVLCRCIYKPADISRIDKILTAYGYRFTKVLEASDFSNRTYFNYVEGSIKVGSLPKWWADGIAAQVGTGVRVWHVKPNHSYYSSNPIRVTP